MPGTQPKSSPRATCLPGTMCSAIRKLSDAERISQPPQKPSRLLILKGTPRASLLSTTLSPPTASTRFPRHGPAPSSALFSGECASRYSFSRARGETCPLQGDAEEALRVLIFVGVVIAIGLFVRPKWTLRPRSVRCPPRRRPSHPSAYGRMGFVTRTQELDRFYTPRSKHRPGKNRAKTIHWSLETNPWGAL